MRDRVELVIRPSDAFVLGVMSSTNGAKVQVDNLRRNRNAASRVLKR
jgi:hypothetical protein